MSELKYLKLKKNSKFKNPFNNKEIAGEPNF